MTNVATEASVETSGKCGRVVWVVWMYALDVRQCGVGVSDAPGRCLCIIDAWMCNSEVWFCGINIGVRLCGSVLSLCGMNVRYVWYLFFVWVFVW